MKLKELRKAHNLKLKEVATMLNIAVSTYNGYELEKTQPSFDILIKMADFFKVSVDYLIGHQSNNLLDISGYPEETKNLLHTIMKLDNFQAERVKAFIIGMQTGQQQIKQEYKNRF